MRLGALTAPFQPRPSHVRRLSAHLFELTVALGWLLVAASYITDPTATLSASPIGRELPAYLYIGWSVLELGGALGVIVGLTARLANHRVAGLVALGTGLLIHGLAAIASGFDLRDLIYLLNAGACFTRAYLVTRWALEEGAR